jgi:hypothetical protein
MSPILNIIILNKSNESLKSQEFLSHSGDLQIIIQLDLSLRCLQQPVTDPYPEPH